MVYSREADLLEAGRRYSFERLTETVETLHTLFNYKDIWEVNKEKD